MGYSEGNVGQDPPRPQYRTQNERKRPERAQLTLGDYLESAKLQEGKQHPTKDRPSILMTLPKGMDNKGQTRWWEEVSLSMVRKGAPVIAFTNPPPDCDLVPCINDSLLKKGVQSDRVVMERKECNGNPAARFYLCKDSRKNILQRPKTRAGYVRLRATVLPSPTHGADPGTSA